MNTQRARYFSNKVVTILTLILSRITFWQNMMWTQIWPTNLRVETYIIEAKHFFSPMIKRWCCLSTSSWLTWTPTMKISSDLPSEFLYFMHDHADGFRSLEKWLDLDVTQEGQEIKLYILQADRRSYLQAFMCKVPNFFWKAKKKTPQNKTV